jgi:hypothetical protein
LFGSIYLAFNLLWIQAIATFLPARCQTNAAYAYALGNHITPIVAAMLGQLPALAART